MAKIYKPVFKAPADDYLDGCENYRGATPKEVLDYFEDWEIKAFDVKVVEV